jgi:hypothetical protein
MQGMVALAEALGLASHLQLLLLWGNVFGPVASKVGSPAATGLPLEHH